MGASQSTPSAPSPVAVAKPSAVAPTNTTAAADKPKPCCVCKEEKSKRDECMLFSNAKDPAEDCKSLVEQYRACMSGYGFQV
ncbi:Cytochrome c oxidase copper chaperone [Fusarium piperis]|uniref:Cytochrome c oxidase copper chaperone n=1 Tax=Fusarium piperis TaxID=1435070 RepID=A0A9W8W6Z1_9HYPO|nr:Cytochrome c oxidase copper chaperone [Fusarium piperis]